MAEAPTSISISPTGEFFESNPDEPQTVRVWRGTTSSGNDVIALVAGLQIEADDLKALNLTQVPPPVKAWSDVMNLAMAAIWKQAERLSDEEIQNVLNLVTICAGYRDPGMVEQKCARCEATYRGPAMYCSFRCAAVDA